MTTPIENALLDAVANNRVSEANILLKLFKSGTNYNINAVNEEGQTVLHLACLYAPEVLHSLFPKGVKNPYQVNLNREDTQNKTALYYVCEMNHLERINILLEQDDAIDLVDGFRIAVEKGHQDIVFKLFEVDKNNLLYKGDHHSWIIGLAKRNLIKPIETLLLLGGFIDFNKMIGMQLLNIALRQSSKELMSLYILFGGLSGKIVTQELSDFLKTMDLSSYYTITIKSPSKLTDSLEAMTAISDLQRAHYQLQNINKGFFGYVAFKNLLSAIAFDWSRWLKNPQKDPKSMIALYYKLVAIKIDSPDNSYSEIFNFIKNNKLEDVFTLPHEKLTADLLQLTQLLGDKYAHNNTIVKLNLLNPRSLISTVLYQTYLKTERNEFSDLIKAGKNTIDALEKIQFELNSLYDELKKLEMSHSLVASVIIISAILFLLLTVFNLIQIIVADDIKEVQNNSTNKMQLEPVRVFNYTGDAHAVSLKTQGELGLSIVLVAFSAAAAAAAIFLLNPDNTAKTRTLLYRARPLYFLPAGLHVVYENLRVYLKIIALSLEETHPATKALHAILQTLNNYNSVSCLLDAIEKLIPMVTHLKQEMLNFNQKLEPAISEKGKEKLIEVKSESPPALLLPAGLCALDLNSTDHMSILKNMAKQPPLLVSFGYKSQTHITISDESTTLLNENKSKNSYFGVKK